MNEYVKSFVIGSSWPVFILYFLAVAGYGDKINVSYKNYTFIAPLFLWNIKCFWSRHSK